MLILTITPESLREIADDLERGEECRTVVLDNGTYLDIVAEEYDPTPCCPQDCSGPCTFPGYAANH